MAWVSKKVYAILKSAQKQGNSDANFVDELKTLSDNEAISALDNFFGGGGFSRENYDEIMAEINASNDKEKAAKEKLPKQGSEVIKTQKGKVQFGKITASQTMKQETLGSLNEVLGQKKVTEDEVEKLAEIAGYYDDGRMVAAMKEFAYDFNNREETYTMLEYDLKMPDGTFEKIKIYNPNRGAEWIKQRQADGKKWISEEIEEQSNQRLKKDKTGVIPIKNENQVFIVVGLPGAGKSTTAASFIMEEYGCYEIDSDIFKGKMPEATEINPETGRKRNNAGRTHEESGQLRDDFEDEIISTKTVNGNLPNLVVPTVGGSEKTIMKRLEKYEKLGYKVNIVNAYATTENALKRNKGRYLSTLDKPNAPTRAVGVGTYASETVDNINFAFESVIEKNSARVNSWAIYDGNQPFGEKPSFVDGSELWNDFFGKK
jgi:hypothetical protein